MLWGKETQNFFVFLFPIALYTLILTTVMALTHGLRWLETIPTKVSVLPFFLPQKGAFSSSEPRGFLGVVTIRRDFLRLGHNGFTYLILLNLPTITLIEIPGPDLDLFHLASLFWSPPFHLFPNEDFCRSRGSGIHPIPKCWGYKNSTFCWHQAGTRV